MTSFHCIKELVDVQLYVRYEHRLVSITIKKHIIAEEKFKHLSNQRKQN